MARTIFFRRLILALQDARRQNLVAEDRPVPRLGKAPVTRRQILAGAAAVAAGTTARPFHATAQSEKRVGVIGAGIAGLSAAHYLLAQGLDVQILEGRSRIGGRMHSVVGPIGPDLIADLGGEFVNTDHIDMRALCAEYGIGLFNREEAVGNIDAPEDAFYFAGKAVTRAELVAALRGIAVQIATDADRVYSDHAALVEIDAMTVAAYLDEHAALMLSPIARPAIESGIRSEYGVEPDEASAIALIWNLPTIDGEHVDLIPSDEVFAIDGGSQSLPLAMAERFGNRIELRAVVTGIAEAGDGFTVQKQDGSSLRFDALVVTMPFPPLRRVALQLPLPDLFRRFVAEFGPGRNEKLIAAFAGRPWRQETAFSLAALTGTTMPAAWDTSLRQPNLDIAGLTCFYGGAGAIAIESLTADAVARQSFERIEPLVPGIAAAATGKHVKTAWGRDRFIEGAYVTYRPGQLTTFEEYFWEEGESAAAHKGPVFGRVAFAGEHLSAEFGGFMNGGAETGRLAAESIAAALAT